MTTTIRPFLSLAATLSLSLAASGCERPGPDDARGKAASAVHEAGRDAAAGLRELARASLVRRGVAAAAPASVELTIDPAVQAIADAEVASLSAAPTTRAASVVVLDPSNGDVLAMAGREGGAPADDLAARAAGVPGSVMKTFGVAAAVDGGVLREGQTVSGEDGSYVYEGRPIRDSLSHGAMTAGDVLAFSSNVGAAKIFELLGGEALSRALARLHFGERPGIELEGAAAGELPAGAEWAGPRGAAVAYGGDGRATPLQVAAAFAAVVNGGTYVAPGLVRRVRGAGGETLFERRVTPERALRPEASRAMRELLQAPVQRDDGTAVRARIAGFRVAGKTGTCDPGGEGPKAVRASFVGAVPAEQPRLVIMVAVDTTEEGYSGGTIAAPAFARVGGKALGALGVKAAGGEN
jgi:cell division protein FtsI (penicillin-binding protein 3)